MKHYLLLVLFLILFFLATCSDSQDGSSMIPIDSGSSITPVDSGSSTEDSTGDSEVTISSIYNYESLNNGPLNGQDSWVVHTNSGSCTNPGGNDCATGLPTIEACNSSGDYVGSKCLYGMQNGWYPIIWISRVNNQSWNYSIPVNTTKLSISVDIYNVETAGNSRFNLFTDTNVNGQWDSGEEGIGFGVDNWGSFFVRDASGVEHSSTNNLPAANKTINLRLDIDMTANSGQGSGTLSHKDLTFSGNNYVIMNELSGVNMLFDTAAADNQNPANLNGIVYIQNEVYARNDNFKIEVTTPE